MAPMKNATNIPAIAQTYDNASLACDRAWLAHTKEVGAAGGRVVFTGESAYDKARATKDAAYTAPLMAERSAA